MLAPDKEYWPGWQAEQLTDKGKGAASPAAQNVHWPAPEREYAPARQPRQVFDKDAPAEG